MEPHHTATIENIIAEFQKDPDVEALLLGGSLAHGFARPDSDVDVMIVVSSDDYNKRKAEGRLHYFNRTPCTYEEGYVDGKYVDVEFLRLVAARGSDPARFAFLDAGILFSRRSDLGPILHNIVRFPREQKQARIDRFVAQLLAWRWYYSEAVRQDNRYLRYLALQKIVLFGCRLILTKNELLFPYHKWLLRVVQTAREQPTGFPEAIHRLLAADSKEAVEEYCSRILEFIGKAFADVDPVWPMQFMKDTELAWMAAEPAVDDL